MEPNPARRFEFPHFNTRPLAYVLFELIAMSGVFTAHAVGNPILYNLILPESLAEADSEITIELAALNCSPEPVVHRLPNFNSV